MRLLLTLAITAASTVVNAFVFIQPPVKRSRGVMRMAIEDAQVLPATSKGDLMANLAGGSSVSTAKRVIVNELLLKLEAANPTAAPATSPLLNGAWDLAYYGGFAEGIVQSPTRQLALFLYAGGYAPTNFGLNLAELLPNSLIDVTKTQLTISRTQPRVESVAEVKIAGASVPTTLSITSMLETESDVRLKETYTAFTVAENKFEVPETVQYTRLLFVTYLDEDLMVVRDDTGVPEIMVRKDMSFQEADTPGEPSSADDDLAPGAG